MYKFITIWQAFVLHGEFSFIALRSCEDSRVSRQRKVNLKYGEELTATVKELSQ
jgi:hypothetical protein